MIPPRLSGVFSVSTRVAWERQWYERLGWRSERTDHTFVPYPLGDGIAFSLWSLASAAPSVAAVVAVEGGFCGALVGLVVDTPEEVDSTLEAVKAAGGQVAVGAHEQPFGRSGWWVDPVGTTWEVSWIDGQSSEIPFAGATLPGALPASLAGVAVASADPPTLETFYADGLGWADRRGRFGDAPALELDHGTLVFLSAADAETTGPVPLLRPHPGVDATTVVDRLVDLGARPADGGVMDPFGLRWIVATGA